MKMRELFVSDVTRDIPPVVYFHEQSPKKLAEEVSEYIITGGWTEGHPNKRRVPDGIHEQYVRLLTGIAQALARPGGPSLPTAWISGFYGSGKSSFAKLLGLALDGVALPDGTSLAEAWLRRDTSPRADELREAWSALRQKLDAPLSVVFDVGSVARDNEHIHAVAIRQVQHRLGYCSSEPLVADFELKLERDGEWQKFLEAAEQALGKPWEQVKDKALAEDDFSLVLSRLYPERYPDPMAWFLSRGGTHQRAESPEEAVAAIRDMLRFRRPGATLFLVVDEVSQYVLANRDRVDRLRAFATALGAGLKGQVWLLALGQQKLEEQADESFLLWAKDRFPPELRVHLAATNIRDVVHRRLLQKTPEGEEQLRALFAQHRPALKLYAYGCEAVTPDEFVEVYPLLPGHIDLLLQITTALRTRSARAQGDDQAIRGLLQLLGELFRTQQLAEQPVGHLVTLELIYDVQHTALDADVQQSMARIHNHCRHDKTDLRLQVAKAVALLELIQESVATDAALVARCLYDRVGRGNRLDAVRGALEALRHDNLLGYSEKLGYRIQSTAGEEWERERRDIGAGPERRGPLVQDALKTLLNEPARPRHAGRPFPWNGLYSDGRRAEDVSLLASRDPASLTVDFRFVPRDEQTRSGWVRRSAEEALAARLLWVVGDSEGVDDAARELARSLAMVRKYEPRRESLNPARRLLLQQEKNRGEELRRRLLDGVASAFMAGSFYFRGQAIDPSSQGAGFAGAVLAAAQRVLPELFPHFVATQVQPAELLQLLAPELAGPSPKFLAGALGILELDGGRYVPACSGVVPRRVLEHVEGEEALSGRALLTHFGKPPYGYAAGLVKACVAGLLRAGKLRAEPDTGAEITAIRDAGVRELFEKDRSFRRATFQPAGEDEIGPQVRARICKFFKKELGVGLDREDHLIADAVGRHFMRAVNDLRGVQQRLNRLPGSPAGPSELARLDKALEACLGKVRQTRPTVKAVKKHLDALRDGLRCLAMLDAELTDDALSRVRRAAEVQDHQLAQLTEAGALSAELEAAGRRIAEHLDGPRPWREISALDPDLERVREAYRAERRRLLEWQESRAEAARGKLKARKGFSTLAADPAHKVLRPLHSAVTDTSAEAVAPPLERLRDPFLVGLERAEAEANTQLDKLLSRGPKPLIVTVDLGLKHRELEKPQDLERLVEDIRSRLRPHLDDGKRVRLV